MNTNENNFNAQRTVVDQAFSFARKKAEAGEWSWEFAFNWVKAVNENNDQVVDQAFTVENVGWDA